MGKNLVIVESPAKAKTIGRFLGPAYQVESSYGHVRDLPQNAKEIPAAFRKQGWARHSPAPHQHLQIARLRALETARPMARATCATASAMARCSAGLARDGVT